MDASPLNDAYRSLSMMIWTDIAHDLRVPGVKIVAVLPDQTFGPKFRDEVLAMLRASKRQVYEATPWRVTGPGYQIMIHPLRATAFRGRAVDAAYIPMGTTLPEDMHGDLSTVWETMIPCVASGLRVVEY